MLPSLQLLPYCAIDAAVFGISFDIKAGFPALAGILAVDGTHAVCWYPCYCWRPCCCCVTFSVLKSLILMGSLLMQAFFVVADILDAVSWCPCCSGYFAFNALRSTPFVTRYTTVAVITAGVPGAAGNLAVVVVLAVAGVRAVIGVPTVLFCGVFTSLPPACLVPTSSTLPVISPLLTNTLSPVRACPWIN